MFFIGPALRRTEKERVVHMDMDTRMLLFLVSMSLVLVMGFCLWMNNILTAVHLRKTLTRDTVVAQFCHGDYFDLARLLKVYRISPRPHQVEVGMRSYKACLGARDNVKLMMHQAKDVYYLDAVQDYLDKNWQFTGWFDAYDGHDDRGKREFTVVGSANGAEAAVKQQLPSFRLSRHAIEGLFEAIRVSAE